MTASATASLPASAHAPVPAQDAPPLSPLLTDELVYVDPADVAARGLPARRPGTAFVTDEVVCWLARLVGRADFFGLEELRFWTAAPTPAPTASNGKVPHGA